MIKKLVALVLAFLWASTSVLADGGGYYESDGDLGWLGAVLLVALIVIAGLVVIGLLSDDRS